MSKSDTENNNSANTTTNTNSDNNSANNITINNLNNNATNNSNNNIDSSPQAFNENYKDFAYPSPQNILESKELNLKNKEQLCTSLDATKKEEQEKPKEENKLLENGNENQTSRFKLDTIQRYYLEKKEIVVDYITDPKEIEKIEKQIEGLKNTHNNNNENEGDHTKLKKWQKDAAKLGDYYMKHHTIHNANANANANDHHETLLNKLENQLLNIKDQIKKNIQYTKDIITGQDIENIKNSSQFQHFLLKQQEQQEQHEQHEQHEQQEQH